MERLSKEGDRPVSERKKTPVGIPSTTEHVEFCWNLGGPPSKAKHSLLTDSELVPRGKGEKNRDERSEIEHETVYLQAVQGLSKA